jgi:thymidine kinase
MYKSMVNCGTLKIILGCMFSGKTTALIREFREWSSIKKKPLCINYIGDDRYGNVCENNMYNHNLLSVECIHVSKLEEVNDDLVRSADIILINEGQFFSDLVPFCQKWCEQYGKNIVVCGLDGDYKREMFGEILKLIPLADSVEKLNAFCARCADGTKAHFTHRCSKETDQIIIGSSNYISLCRSCYKKEIPSTTIS